MSRSIDHPRPPGMHDVARLAGVSHQTVSRVLNNHPSVRPDTRDRVIAAIGELGYRRNTAARALVTRHSSTIGVVTSGSSLWGPSSALIGVEHAAREAGYFVSLASLNGTGPADIAEALTHFLDQAVEGIIVIAPEAAMVHAADPFVAQVPVVMVGAGAEPSPGVHITSVDQEAGARLATRHLIEQGHRVITHVAGPPSWFDGSARRRGWQAELETAGLVVEEPFVGDWTAESGYTAGQILADAIGAWDKSGDRPGATAGSAAAVTSGTDGPPTAIFVANDLMALGVVRALHDAGVAVPQQVSVVGFDDMPGAAHFIPGLTTVRQDFEALGRQCIEILLTAMNGTAEVAVPIPPALVIRQSTGPAPKGQ